MLLLNFFPQKSLDLETVEALNSDSTDSEEAAGLKKKYFIKIFFLMFNAIASFTEL